MTILEIEKKVNSGEAVEIPSSHATVLLNEAWRHLKGDIVWEITIHKNVCRITHPRFHKPNV